MKRDYWGGQLEMLILSKLLSIEFIIIFNEGKQIQKFLKNQIQLWLNEFIYIMLENLRNVSLIIIFLWLTTMDSAQVIVLKS